HPEHALQAGAGDRHGVGAGAMLSEVRTTGQRAQGLGLAVLLLAAAPVHAATCESLASLTLPNTTITSAQTVAAGAFTPQPRGRGQNPFSDLPAFCRVAATITPSADSDIKVEVWLPSAKRNNKLQAVG